MRARQCFFTFATKDNCEHDRADKVLSYRSKNYYNPVFIEEDIFKTIIPLVSTNVEESSLHGTMQATMQAKK